MRSRPKAAITTTVRSRPETSRLSRNEISPQGDPHRGRRRSDVNQGNGSEERQRHHERVLLIGRGAMRTSIRASGTIVSAPTGRRHDRTRSVRTASTKPLTTGRRPDMPFPVGTVRKECARSGYSLRARRTGRIAPLAAGPGGSRQGRKRQGRPSLKEAVNASVQPEAQYSSREST